MNSGWPALPVEPPDHMSEIILPPFCASTTEVPKPTMESASTTSRRLMILKTPAGQLNRKYGATALSKIVVSNSKSVGATPKEFGKQSISMAPPAKYKPFTLRRPGTCAGLLVVTAGLALVSCKQAEPVKLPAPF